MSNFLRDRDFGEQGEAYLQDWFKNNHGIDTILVNEVGHDIAVASSFAKLEVKSDRWALQTGNILFEIWSHWDRKNPGWVQTSPAEVLVYLLYDRGSQSHQPNSIIFYNFIALRNFLFWTVFGGSWFNAPLVGEIKQAKAAGNTHVRNLILPRKSVMSFELSDAWLVEQLKNKGMMY